MLSQKNKILFLEEYLNEKNDNYADVIKNEINFILFDLGNYNFDFLEKAETKNDIRQKIDFIVSKIILHEHEDGFNSILEKYV